MRSFRDETGVEWEVREISDPTLSVVPRRLLRHPAFGDGWLLFTSDGERRRLAPYPADWHALSERELCSWCRKAQLAPRARYQVESDARPASSDA